MTNDIRRFGEFQKAKAIGEKGNALNDAIVQAAALSLITNQTREENKSDIGAKLKKLKELFENGLIDEGEYKAKKADLLSEFNA
ncbi:MAG: SHOCT domain-containing protein [Helicobacteraceae bacterium]|nr:SHOCT domain-containing protein [Helicobacteraceae bacterium]